MTNNDLPEWLKGKIAQRKKQLPFAKVGLERVGNRGHDLFLHSRSNGRIDVISYEDTRSVTPEAYRCRGHPCGVCGEGALGVNFENNIAPRI
jgi:hypothetical protein